MQQMEQMKFYYWSVVDGSAIAYDTWDALRSEFNLDGNGDDSFEVGRFSELPENFPLSKFDGKTFVETRNSADEIEYLDNFDKLPPESVIKDFGDEDRIFTRILLGIPIYFGGYTNDILFKISETETEEAMRILATNQLKLLGVI